MALRDRDQAFDAVICSLQDTIEIGNSLIKVQRVRSERQAAVNAAARCHQGKRKKRKKNGKISDFLLARMFLKSILLPLLFFGPFFPLFSPSSKEHAPEGMEHEVPNTEDAVRDATTCFTRFGGELAAARAETFFYAQKLQAKAQAELDLQNTVG